MSVNQQNFQAMKPKYIYLIFALFSITFTIFLISRGNEKSELTLLERTGGINNSSEWINTKAAIEKLQADLRGNSHNLKAKLQLALAYIQESRVTGNHGYYDKAAMELIDEILAERKNDYEAMCAKATILLSQHHFSDALKIGKKIVQENVYSAYGYGILTDANVESGNYEEAVQCADKMVSLRPDIRSYSRVSYLREIFGDNEGAIEAMKMAVISGIPGAEQTEWARVYVGHLCELKGDLESAENFYKEALIHRPQYAYGLAGMGRVEKSKRNFNQAIKYFERAKLTVKDYSFYDELADIYNAMQLPEKANMEVKEAMEMLSAGNGNEGNNFHGHYADRELALLYLKSYKFDLAYQHAMTEYSRRPANIDVNQTLAWVQYKRGELADANKKITVSLKTNSQNPTLLFQAGLIKAKNGELAQGKNLMLRALAINKYIAFDLLYEGKKYLNHEELYAQK